MRRFLYVRPDDLPRDLSGACGVHYKTMINWASLILLLASIALLTTQSHCAQDSPGLFYLVLVLSMLGYLCLALLLILWFLVLFCLNGLVVLLELFGVGPRVMQWQGATPNMIDDIPVIKFTKYEQQKSPASRTEKSVGVFITPSIVVSDEPARPPAAGLPDGDGLSGNVMIDMEPAISPLEPVLVGTGAGIATTTQDDTDPLSMLALEHLSPEERELVIRISTACPICLCDYEDLEELRQLPCDHYFHKECVDEWLKLKRTCPLCKCDITRSKRGGKRWSLRSNGGHGRSRSSGSGHGSGHRRLSLGARRA
ncbi:hypothetical protein EDD11_005681 [Mortierella claussenii]|nr:hypothetical protein EDD11_005681 [Mortierella claussenii]